MLDQREVILFANEAFYRAFADHDYEAMEEAWAREAPVSCAHPGWGPLHGRDAVLQSWLAILANPEAPEVAYHAPRAFQHGEMAYVICYEEIAETMLLATNIFVHEDGRWRLVHHLAGPTDGAPPEEEASVPPHRVN
ncbi:MAG TPA: nuclear transport factor 2 family protein [Alphaproteobacteria bacterium]|jgi:hypothetical protein|nr:nuclear transport factor 2 family protein [Alphaproteobacteria bacterium]